MTSIGPSSADHGSPGSRRLFRPDAELAATQFGLRLLSYDRPGYGGRPRREGRRVADAVTDVRSIAAALDIERLGIWGFSGGGCYALACAALLPDLITGAAVFASFAPYGSPAWISARACPASTPRRSACSSPTGRPPGGTGARTPTGWRS